MKLTNLLGAVAFGAMAYHWRSEGYFGLAFAFFAGFWFACLFFERRDA